MSSGNKDAKRNTFKKFPKEVNFFLWYFFIRQVEGAGVHDGMGATAMDGIEKAVGEFDHEAFTALWKSVSEQNSTDGEEPSAGAQPTV